MMFKRIPDQFIKDGVQQNVFAAIYAEDGIPYKNHKTPFVPVVMMQLRWDCAFGFPGGKVDPGENLMDALVREVKEEVNYDISHHIQNVHLIASYSNEEETVGIHCFGIHVSYQEIKSIRINALNGDDVDADVDNLENLGNILVPVVDYGDRGGYRTFLKNMFIATAKMELEELVLQKGWMS